MQINRLFGIVYVLLAQKSATAKELAERFEVSQRTIYRDVNTLSLVGIPIYTEKGKGGGISLLPEFVLNKSILSKDEQVEILAALQGLSAVKTADTKEVLDKLGVFFNRNATNWIEVDFSDWSYQNGEIFSKLKAAIIERRVIEFDYFNASGEQSRRRVEPIQLWFKSKSWYFKAFCLAKNDLRTFRLTRIRNLVISDEVFPVRDLLASVTQNQPIKEPLPDVQLILKIAPERTYRVYDEFCQDSVKRNDDGSFTVTVTWPENEWVYATILSYGEHIEVLEPEHIRKICAEKARSFLQKHL